VTAIQTTLTGDETGAEREKPETFMWCDETEQWVLRSLRGTWPYDLYPSPDDVPEGRVGFAYVEEDEDEPERAGGIYQIELSYSADFIFNIPAWSEHEAEERAKELVDYPHNCGDMYHVHTRRTELKELFTDDAKVPDDWDPYSGTPLWEVWGETDEDEETDPQKTLADLHG
jgi:hypothetical protein